MMLVDGNNSQIYFFKDIIQCISFTLMTSHDLFEQLLDLAAKNNIRQSTTSSIINSQSEILDEFKSKVKDIKSILRIINNNNASVLNLRNTLVHNASAKKEQEINQKIIDIIDQNSQLMVSIRALVQVITKIIQKEQKENENNPETLSKAYQKKFLLEEITKVMKESSKIEVLYKKWTVADAVRNIQLFDSSITEDQATNIAKSSNGYMNFLKEKQLGSASLKMKYRIQDIIQKNHAIKKLQKSILENLQLIKQIAVMVKQQGQLLDSIEENMLDAKEHVQKAVEVLDKEKKIQQKNRKKICCIIFVGLALLAIVLVPIIVKMTRKK